MVDGAKKVSRSTAGNGQFSHKCPREWKGYENGLSTVAVFFKGQLDKYLVKIIIFGFLK